MEDGANLRIQASLFLRFGKTCRDYHQNQSPRQSTSLRIYGMNFILPCCMASFTSHTRTQAARWLLQFTNVISDALAAHLHINFTSTALSPQLLTISMSVQVAEAELIVPHCLVKFKSSCSKFIYHTNLGCQLIIIRRACREGTGRTMLCTGI